RTRVVSTSEHRSEEPHSGTLRRSGNHSIRSCRGRETGARHPTVPADVGSVEFGGRHQLRQGAAGVHRARRVLLLEEPPGAPGGRRGEREITNHSARVLVGLLASSLGGLLVACATQADLRTTSRDLTSKNEELRSELKDARQRSAEVETSLREIKGQDLSQMLGQLETQRRDVDMRHSVLDDQKAQVYSLEKKLQDRLGGSEKRAEMTDRGVAQVAEKVREIGTKLSTQMDQQAGALVKLEEEIKHSDLQMRALSAEVNRFQGVLAEFDKVLRALNDKAIDVDRRVTELTGRIEVKVGTLATQQ